MSSHLYEHEEKTMSENLKDSLVISQQPLAISTTTAPIRRRTRAQNLTLTEEERMEEARDTVDDNDIQLTHGMDSESADKLSPLPVDMDGFEQPINQSITPFRKVGRVGHERTSSLDKMLSSRMTRQMFENKFLQREITAESMCNRQAELSRLLAQRPSREKLEHNNIIKTKLATNLSAAAEQLTQSQKRDRLNNLIAKRPGQLDLAQRNILLPGETMSARSRMMTRVPDAS